MRIARRPRLRLFAPPIARAFAKRARRPAPERVQALAPAVRWPRAKRRPTVRPRAPLLRERSRARRRRRADERKTSDRAAEVLQIPNGSHRAAPHTTEELRSAELRARSAPPAGRPVQPRRARLPRLQAPLPRPAWSRRALY